MSTPARYWIVLFTFAAVLCACAARGGSPLPFVPQAAMPAGDGAVLSPETLACATDRNQPGWVFRGVCKFAGKLAAGKTIVMPQYAGFTVTYKIPKNSASSQKIVFAVANLTNVAARKGRHKLGPFPPDGPAFLYFKTANRGTAIHFRKHTQVVFEVAFGSSTALTGPCVIDNLQKISGTWTWKSVPVANKIVGNALTLSISRRHYSGIPHGPAYYAVTCSEAPTPTPSPKPTKKPTPTPSHSPTPKPSSTPAYCANYSVPTTNTVPVNVTDGSNLGASVVMYVWNGRAWMDNAGTFTTPEPSANPLPLDCFPKSTGSKKGLQFALPPNLAGSRLYIAYAVPASTKVVPNPLAGMAGATGPALAFGNAFWNVPWDVIELGTTNGAIVDLTALTNLGLPLEIAQAPPGSSSFAQRVPKAQARPRIAERAIPAPCATSGAGIVGVTSCNYDNIYTALSSIPQYQNLVASGTFNGKIVDLRIINPAKTLGTWNFGNDWFYNRSYLSPYPPACSGVPTPLANGYLSCVLGSYATTSRLYATAGSGVAKVTGNNYCVSSDGSANFGFTSIGKATSCTGITYSSPGTLPMPVAVFKYGTPPVSADGRGCQAGVLFGLQPTTRWITSGSGKHPSKHPNVFRSPDAFAVWKALAIDLTRGAALSTGSHPAGGWGAASPAAFSNYYNDPVGNEYAHILHYYYDHNQATTFLYDNVGAQISAFRYATGNALDIRINAVPTAAAVSPVATPAPFPLPSPCTVFPTGV